MNHAIDPAIDMSEVKAAKDALVASLFELSKSAQDAASATANLYKVSHTDSNVPIDSLTNLSKAINTLVASIEIPGGALDYKKPEKKKKVEKDPNAPKKPLTMYFAYLFHIREQIRDERKANGLPPLSAIEMNAYVKDRWSKLSDGEKSIWQKKYQEELKEYNKQKELYKAKLAGVVKPVIPIELPKDIVESDDSSSESFDEIEPVQEKKKEKKRKHDKEKSDKKKKNKK